MFEVALHQGHCALLVARGQGRHDVGMLLVRVLGRDLPLRELTTGRVRDYWQARQAEGASSHTIDKEHAALRVALHLAAERGLWSGDLRALKPQGLGSDCSH